MYLEHYGIRETPFSLTPDTSFFFQSMGVQEALNVVSVALDSGEGIIKITGEVGTGKTLLCRKLLGEMSDRYAIAYVPNPLMNPTDLVRALADELGVPFDAGVGFQRLLNQLLQRMIGLAGEARRGLIMVDEAQALPDDTLEALRLLTNLETEKHKILQVVLFGQPELDERLAEPQARALRQRITFSHEMRPFTHEEMTAYVNHRLAVSGWRGRPLFDDDALALLHQVTDGVPRLVNVLCHKAMMSGFGQGVHTITRQQVAQAVADTDSVKHRLAGLPPHGGGADGPVMAPAGRSALGWLKALLGR